VLEHAERHAAEEPGRELAASWQAEQDQVRSPLTALGGDRPGSLADEGVPTISLRTYRWAAPQKLHAKSPWLP